jgi:aryl-alcohol dehydrogenase-like predicted oxidoreductase
MAAVADEVPKMKSVRLGKTGLRVSEMVLGAMTFGTKDKNAWGVPTADEATSHALLDRYVAAGGFTIDTADVYGYGESEEVLGRWLEPRPREELVIATKARAKMGADENSGGLSRKHIVAAVEASLERLRTPYIDIFQFHQPDTSCPIEESLRAVDDLIRAGKIRYLGVSNFNGWQLKECMRVCDRMGLSPVICNQQQYSLMCRDIEWDSLKVSQDEGMGTIAWSPLAGGWLTGRYKREEAAPKEGRVAWAQKAGWKATDFESKASDPQVWATLDVLKRVAEEHGVSQASVALRWVMQRPGITAPIIGARKMTQLEDNIAATRFELTKEQMAALTEVSTREAPYPFNMWYQTSR